MNESVNGSIEVVALRLAMFIWVTAAPMLMSQVCKPKTDENASQKIPLATNETGGVEDYFFFFFPFFNSS